MTLAAQSYATTAPAASDEDVTAEIIVSARRTTALLDVPFSVAAAKFEGVAEAGGYTE